MSRATNGGTPAGRVLGAVIAGGHSSRYGRNKALETVGGERLVDRVAGALAAVTPDVVLITNDAAFAGQVGLVWRPDALPDLGALGGIHAALLWAHERGHDGVLAVACDMPFLEPALLQTILAAARDEAADVVVPESGSKRGIEPLCAYYGTGCIAAIERAIESGDRRMIGFHDAVRLVRVPASVVARHGDAERMFFNVNTRAERERAERMLAAGGPAGAD